MRQSRLLLSLFYLGPLALWVGVLFAASTPLGDYNASWRLVWAALQFIAGDKPPVGTEAMYQLVEAQRRVGHIVAFGILAALVVRALQWGRSVLRRRSLVAALLLSVAYAGAGALHRNLVPGRHGDWRDVLLDTLGAVFVLVALICWFRVKNWEHRALEDRQ